MKLSAPSSEFDAQNTIENISNGIRSMQFVTRDVLDSLMNDAVEVFY